MILLALIMIGYLTTTAIHTRTTSVDLAKAEARANAKLALSIALGEIQRELGPDQRISAQAGVLDESPDTLKIDGVEHPRWSVVWNTDFDGEGASPWDRDDSSGGLEDRRMSGNWNREDAISASLVSGNEGGKEERASDFLDPKSPLPGGADERVTMVGKGSLGEDADALADGQVVVPKVLKYHDGEVSGGYGYWVGDLNVKANVALVDPYSDEDPKPGSSARGMERLLNAPDVDLGVVDGVDALAPEDRAKMVSGASLAMAPGASKESAQRLFHDVTTTSRTVLANVRDGDLKRDLSVYLGGGDTDLKVNGQVVKLGVKDDDRLAGPANAQEAGDLYNDGRRVTSTSDKERLFAYDELAPRFFTLKDWFNSAEDLNYSAAETPAVAPMLFPDSPTLRINRANGNVYDDANERPAAFYPYRGRHVKNNLTPILVEGSMYYHLATYPESSRNSSGQTQRKWFLRMCMYPRFVLWNPYNVDMELPRLCAQIMINGKPPHPLQ